MLPGCIHINNENVIIWCGLLKSMIMYDEAEIVKIKIIGHNFVSEQVQRPTNNITTNNITTQLYETFLD